MQTRTFQSQVSQMSDEKKTEWILNAVTEIDNLEDKLKVLRRKILELHKENKELMDENRRLNAQLEMNPDVIQPGDDDADAHTRTPSVATFTPRKYRKTTSRKGGSIKQTLRNRRKVFK
jgi:hypothetical protein